MSRFFRSLIEISRRDPYKVIAALVATILTAVGILAQNPLVALGGLLVILDLLAFTHLSASRVTQELNERSREIEAKTATIENASIETREIVKHFNIDMLNDARAVGIADIFAKRKHDDRAKLAVFTELEKVRSSGGTVDLLGVALPDYFLRQPYEAYMNDFVHYAGVRALLLHPDSDSADLRERIERGMALTKNDIKASIEVIRTFLEENRKVQGRLYTITPIAFLMLTNDMVFIEQYHLGKVGLGVECIGGHVPFLKIVPVHDLPTIHGDVYTIMRNHFDELWNNSEKIEICLSIEFHKEYGHHSLTITRPKETARKVDLSDWTLRRNGSTDIFSFPPSTVLKPGEAITVISHAGADSEKVKCTEADLWLEGDNLVLRNVAGVRTKTFHIATPS